METGVKVDMPLIKNMGETPKFMDHGSVHQLEGSHPPPIWHDMYICTRSKKNEEPTKKHGALGSFMGI